MKNKLSHVVLGSLVSLLNNGCIPEQSVRNTVGIQSGFILDFLVWQELLLLSISFSLSNDLSLSLFVVGVCRIYSCYKDALLTSVGVGP